MGNNTIIFYVLHTMVYIVLRNISKITLAKLHIKFISELLSNPALNILIAIIVIWALNIFIKQKFPVLLGKKKIKETLNESTNS